MSPRLLTVAAALALLAHVAWAAECGGSPNPNAQPNLNAIYTDDPVFVRSVPNGALYTVGEGDDMIPIVHLWGTPYQKGYAHGQLMKDVASTLLNQTYEYFVDQVLAAINGTAHSLNIPQPIIDEAAAFGIDAACDLTYEMTKDFTGPYFYAEMQGLSDAAGISFETIRRVHMIGEVTKGSCSMFGAWGNATASTDGKLYQLRALDWAMDGPFHNYPQLTVYHNNGEADQGYSFINVGWSGWIASITGMSINQMGISEIGVAFPDASFGKESRIGIPFTNILRDVLQFDETLQDGMTRMTNANRTCDLILGMGDAKTGGGFRGVQYSYSVANFIDDTNFIPVASWHPPIENVVYFGMDWLCPGYNSVLGQQLNAYHGNITAENTIHYITPIVQTGDLHVAIYSLSDMVLHVATAAADDENGPRSAYDRVFNRLDMNAVFAVQQPQFTADN